MARRQVVQMCEEVASRVERAARRLRPPAWFRAAAASPRGFLLAARRPSRLPPWPLPPIDQPPAEPAGGERAYSGSRSAPATLTRRRDRDRHRAADAAEEETWSRDAATLYATPLSSRRHRPESDWKTAPLGGWDSTPPRRHRSQLTLRTTEASPAASSDAGWSQEVRRPYLGWRSLERLSRRLWTPEERLAASLLERSGCSTPTSGKEATAPNKLRAGSQQHQPSGADDSRGRTAASSLLKESAPNASQVETTATSFRKAPGPNTTREGTAASSLRKEAVPTPTSPVTSARTERSTHSNKQVKESSTLSRHVTALSGQAVERNRDAETATSSWEKLDGLSTGSLALRPAEEDSSRKRHTQNENSRRLEQNTLTNVSSYPEVQSQKSPQHNGVLLSTQIKTLPVSRIDLDVDLAHTSHKDQATDTQYFLSAERDALEKTLYRAKSPEKVTAASSRDTKEEKTTLHHQYLNGPSQLPTQLKALSVTTRYSNDDMSAKGNDKDFPARDLLERSCDTAPLHASNIISAPTTSRVEDYYRTTNHLNSATSQSPHDVTIATDQSPVSDSGDIRAKQLPTAELRTRSLEVTLPQRLTTSDTSRKLSIQEQFWVAADRSPSAIEEDPSLIILPLVKQTATAPPPAHSSSTGSNTANRKSAPTFLTSTPVGASPGATTDTKTLSYPVHFDYTSETTSPSVNGTKTFDINDLRSVELCTRSVEIPLPQVTSVISDSPASNFSPSAAAKNSPVPSIKEVSPHSSATIRAVSMPPVPRDRTFCIESPTVLHKGSSTFSQLPAVEFQSAPSDVTLPHKVSTVATTKRNSDRHEAEPIPSGLYQRHSLPASPLVETSLTTIHVTSSPVVTEYQAVYPDSSPLLGRKPFTIKHVEAPSGHRKESSAENTKSREISLSPALPKPFEPMPIPQSKIPVPTTSKTFSEKETAVTTEISHKQSNHIRPNERTQKSSLPVTSVIRRPSYRVATRNELNPSSRKKRSAAGVNFAENIVSKSVAPPAESPGTKRAPIAKPPRLRPKDNATSSPKPPPRQKHTASPLATARSDNVGPIPQNTELHLPNGVSPLPYSALRILDSQPPQNTTGLANTMSVSFKLPVSSESDTPATKRTVSKQSLPALQQVPNPTLLTPLQYKPCTTTDL